jgi:hypothetical protein
VAIDELDAEEGDVMSILSLKPGCWNHIGAVIKNLHTPPIAAFSAPDGAIYLVWRLSMNTVETLRHDLVDIVGELACRFA